MLRRGGSPFEVRNVVNGISPRNSQNAAVIACHGFGRHCFVAVQYGGEQVFQSIPSSVFIRYFAQDQFYQEAIRNALYVKLLVCFSGSRPGGSSIAQKFATALGKTVYGTRGITYPDNIEQAYLEFHSVK